MIGYPENASPALAIYISIGRCRVRHQSSGEHVVIGYQQMPHVVTISNNLLIERIILFVQLSAHSKPLPRDHQLDGSHYEVSIFLCRLLLIKRISSPRTREAIQIADLMPKKELVLFYL